MTRFWRAVVAAVLLSGAGCCRDWCGCCGWCGDRPPQRLHLNEGPPLPPPPPGGVVPPVTPPGTGAYGGMGE